MHRKCHGDVQVTQVSMATLHDLVPGGRGLAGHGALLVHLEAALLGDERVAVEGQGREALVAHAALARHARAALAHARVLLPQGGLLLLGWGTRREETGSGEETG